MIVLYWDNKYGHLLKVDSETLFGNLFDLPHHSQTFNIMVENKSVHDEYENEKIQIMCDYL